MKEQIQTAIASFGMSGQVFHGPLLKVNPGFNVHSVWERSKNISRKLFPEAKIVRDFEELLMDREIELVIVNTPDVLHFSMAKQALQSGKHVVVEKPATLRSAETRELIELAEQKGLVFTVFQNRRWDGDFRTVQKILNEGKLGRLVEFKSHFDRYRTFIAPNTWKEEGGEFAGALYNLGSHKVDQVYVLFGQPKSVNATLKIVRTEGRANDYFDIRLEYEGFSALLKCSYLVKKPGPNFTLHGELGSFHKSGLDHQEEDLKAAKLPVGENWGTESKAEWGTLYYTENDADIEKRIETIPGDYNIFYNNLYDVIRNGAELLVKPEQAWEVLKILEACIESNRTEKTIHL